MLFVLEMWVASEVGSHKCVLAYIVCQNCDFCRTEWLRYHLVIIFDGCYCQLQDLIQVLRSPSLTKAFLIYWTLGSTLAEAR